MKKLFILLFLVSPLAMNAMQRASLAGDPIMGRERHPQTGALLTATTVTVTDIDDVNALKKFIESRSDWKKHVRNIQTAPGVKQLIIWSGLDKNVIQQILNEFNKTVRSAAAKPAAELPGEKPAPAPEKPVPVKEVTVTEEEATLSKELQEHLAKQGVTPPYTIYKFLKLPASATAAQVEKNYNKMIKELKEVDWSKESANNKIMADEFSNYTTNLYNQFKTKP